MAQKATALLEEHIFTQIKQAIAGIPDDQTRDIYALSFWISGEEDDPRRLGLDFSYNTAAQAQAAVAVASDPEEAKWNFAFWLQNQVALVGGPGDTTTSKLRNDWLDENSLNFTDAEEAADFDCCMDLADKIEPAFWELCARVGKRLHGEGIIAGKFGRPIPIVIHNLEYSERVVDVTRQANPQGLVEDFVNWLGSL